MGVEAGQSDESLLVSPGHALGGCLVAVVGIGAGKDWPVEMRLSERRLTLGARLGRYVPHLTWIRTGTQLSVANRLDADLSVHGYLLPGLSNTIFNFAVSPGSEVEPSQAFLEREGVYYVTDDMRRAFTAWVHVLPNPYAEITEAEPRPGRDAGTFQLEDVPAGDYDVVCWHEPADRRERLEGGRFGGYTLGPPVELRHRVHVVAGERTQVEFAVPLGAADEK